MIKLLAIVLGEPNSINSEITVKACNKFKKNKNIFLIGNYLLLKQQISKIGLSIKISKITTFKELNIKNGLNILDIPFKFNSPFENNNASIKKYIFKSLEVAHELALTKKIKGFINLPVNKKVFDSKYLGVTEYLAKKCNLQGEEVMMIHNKKLSVVPLTTHLELSKVTNKIKFSLIKKKMLILNKSYFNIFKEKPRIAILGLNPHNSENRLNSVENKVIKPVVDELKKFNIDIKGPFPADTIFNNQKKIHYNIIVGMYHDQVLAPFKALYGYDAINVTLGLHYLRLSPDHGTAQDIIGLNMGNPQSLISAINFLSKINV